MRSKFKDFTQIVQTVVTDKFEHYCVDASVDSLNSRQPIYWFKYHKENMMDFVKYMAKVFVFLFLHNSFCFFFSKINTPNM